MLKLSITALVALLLGGAGAYWYSTHPDNPLARLVSDGLCKHRLSRAACPFCTPALVEKLGPCREHGVPEALCWICHPRLVAAYKVENDWCGGHDCPESRCTICGGSCSGTGAEPSKPVGARPDDAPHGEEGHAGHNHSRDRSAGKETVDVAIARSQRAPAEGCTTEKSRVRLASVEMVTRAGLTFATIERRAVTQTVSCNAEVAYDGNRFAHLASRVAGIVREVRVDLGTRVRGGEVLAVVESPELAAAKADYLQSSELVTLNRANYERQMALASSGAAATREVQEMRTELAESEIALARAQQRLSTFGLSAAEIAAITASKETGSVLPLTAPFDGEIVDRHAVVGETAEPSRPLFSIAETGRMWAMLDLTDPSAAVRVGQPVLLRVDGMPQAVFEGTLTWISTQLDPRTRTLKARAEFDNADGTLKANMFGRAQITLRAEQPTLLAPKEAVQWDGCCNIVFVRSGPAEFEPRKVRLGPGIDGAFEVLEGLNEGDTVVKQGSFLLKTEILKDQIGAGCCPDDIKKK